LQQRQIRLTPRVVSADCESAQRVAVIAEPARDEVPTLRLAAFDVVLAREFERRLGALGASRTEESPCQACRSVCDQLIGERLLRLVGEESGVGEGEPVDLTLDRFADDRVAVAQAADAGTAGGIQVSAAARIEQIQSFAANGDGRTLTRIATEDVTLGRDSGVVC
jgi:hypothetical protein